jgi:uncharacterized protein YhjY with autotransporter beta-barrel domain
LNNIAAAVSQILAAHRARALAVESPANANGAMGPMVGMFLLTTLGATPAGAADPACAQIVDQACVISTNGGAGAPAKQPSTDGSGHPGGPGGPGGDITNVTLTQQTIYMNDGATSPLDISAWGGAGAQGSNAAKESIDTSGGAGGPGGNGGNITNVTTQGSQIGGIASNATTGLLIWSWGGAGGAAAVGGSQGVPGSALGVGGDGGSISATLDGSWSSQAGTALYVQSEGGAGGRGRDSSASGFSSISPDGANGGNGKDVAVTILGTFEGVGGGVNGPGTTAVGGTFISSIGGAGGDGGPNGSTVGDEGGDGGNGGNAGNVSVTLATGARAINPEGSSSAGLWALSAGGQAGAGGTGSSGGMGGTGGAAGTVSVVLDGTAQSNNGYMSPAVLAQSLGGSGQPGGNGAGWFAPNGGGGGSGGPASTVTISGSGASISTSDGELSPGILAQSIGGGGGTGGRSNGWFAVGGDGANASNGAAVTVNLSGTSVSTEGLQSDGIMVQSIGGGGGKGGDAQGTGLGLNMTIGGTGGGGGAGGSVGVASGAGDLVTTSGDQSAGILLQSIGGGGGDGGAAYGEVKSAFFGAQISVGGSGGAGGDGGAVDLLTVSNGNGGTTPLSTNAGRIVTTGSDSFGILAQSIGGGGGRGGSSIAAAQTYGLDDYPNLAVGVAIGGSGGTGGNATGVTVDNAGMIATSGAGSAGMLLQSVGGGGGSGGDASATAKASGGDVNITSTVAIGGSAANGGSGGTAIASNEGLIVTTGESADGMLVQSVGGGGGVGGTGDGKSSASGGTNIALNLTIGGKGGAGGNSQSVTATNSGAIITLGDGAIGLGAQSIGGGGGSAGGAAGSTSGEYSASVVLGGKGGSGGTMSAGGLVTATNSVNSTIVTFGADATGIFAQSIGGGGGIGGKTATSLATSKSGGDGSNGSSNTQAAIASAASNFGTNGNGAISTYNTLNGAIAFTNSLLGNPAPSAQGITLADDDPEADLDTLSQSKGETDDDNQSKSIAINVGVGGAGGPGGAAGSVLVNNNGEVATTGQESDGIIAQAIGGGGGAGGAASTASSNDYSGNVSVGGNGGTGANGGAVSVNNAGTIITEGALSAGMVAQSIAGSGGIGGTAASSVSSDSKNSGNNSANDGAFSQLNLSLGGNGGGSGTSYQVYATSAGAIETTGHDSIGIIAQSIAGGGGILKSLATDLEGAGGSASSGQTNFDINLSFSGSNGGASSTSSGLVNVLTQPGGTITTKGDDSYGILAQSISGGGGVALGGVVTVADPNVPLFFSNSNTSGNVNNDGINNPGSGNSGLFVTAEANITTSGKGAVGILAQSIGGGGGLAGPTGVSEAYNYFDTEGTAQYVGSGGYVSVAVAQGATVSTSGVNAPAILVQSIGGGGGLVNSNIGAYWGTAGGTGQGGPINITINGTVQASGAGSAGIVAQSMGDATSNSPVKVTVGSTGSIIVGQAGVPTSADGESAGIYIDHGGMDSSHPNVVTNNGQILTYGSVTNSVAVYSSAGYTQVYNNAGATMAGDVLLTNNGGSGCFTNASGATFYAGDKVTVGACGVTNAGTIYVGSTAAAAAKGAGGLGTTTITGNYIQTAGGTLNINADLQAGKADTLVVTGKATIAGTVNVDATTVSNKPVTVLTASGGVSVAPNLSNTDNSALFDFPVVASGNHLDIDPTAHLSSAAANFSPDQKAVANYMQQLFDSGASMGSGFTALSKLAGGADYASSLKSMSGELLGAFGAFRVESSREFSYNLYQGCRELTSDPNTTDSCTWARTSGGSADQSARGDSVGYRANRYTVDFGGQVGLSDRLALVGSLGYESTSFSTNDESSYIAGNGSSVQGNGSYIEGNAALAGMGVNFADGPLELSASLDGAYGWYRSYRTITVGANSEEADASPRQWQLGLHLRSGYEIPMGGAAYFKPFVEGHAILISNDSFTEDGTSPFRLTVDGRTDTTVAGGTGVEFGLHIPTSSGMVVHPFVSAAVELGQNVQWTTTAHFASQSAAQGFAIGTAGPGTYGKFGIGADLINAKNLSFSILYEPEVGDGYKYQGGAARISYRF